MRVVPEPKLPANLVIVRATSTDSPALAELAARMFSETFRGTCGDDDLEQLLSEHYNLEQVAQELSDPHDYFHFLKSADGLEQPQVLGYSRLKADCPPEEFSAVRSIELKRFYFERFAHGGGFAKWLLEWNIHLAKRLGYERLYLSVWEHNHRAKRFYAKHGFIESGILKPYPIGNTQQMDEWYFLNL